MKKSFIALSLSFAAAFLVACGDTVENTTVNQMGMDVVASEDDLPKCNGDNEGDVAFVKDEDASRVCIDGDWKPVAPNGSDFSCKTVELKDKSGLKIVCNGDSIGVVLNGEKGETGKQGKTGESGTGCVITDRNDTAVVVTCGDSTMTIDLNVGLPNDTLEADSERTAISLDSLVGFTQKGPFLKGSTVYLYELSDGRTLKQTNGNFTSKITSDNGRYKFSARDLVSQYAMVVVDGYYRNEVTGGTSDAPIRLTALTDMRKRSSVNVNLLTHMEFDRVYNLVTRGDSTGKKLTVKAAKRQAQKEILKQFHIDLGENTDAEDMDVFGDSDADAALLAVSVLLQGDSNASALSVLLTEISNDIAGYGEWKNKATKAKLADWALQADADGRLAIFSNNVEGWGLGNAPDFAKFVRNYVGVVDGLGVCGSKDVRENRAVRIENPASGYYSKDYTPTSKESKVRFICKADTSKKLRWHVATDIEKDSLDWGHKYNEGDVKKGLVNTEKVYVYENNNWRYGNNLDDTLAIGCIKIREDTVAKGKNGEWYKCIDSVAVNGTESYEVLTWRKASNIEMDTATWGHNSDWEGTVRNGQVNGNLTYVYENGDWREGTELDSLLRRGCVQDRNDTIMKLETQWHKCSDKQWTKISVEEAESLFEKIFQKDDVRDGSIRVSPKGVYNVWDNGLREASEQERNYGKGCVSYLDGDSIFFKNVELGSYYTCIHDKGWVFSSVNRITDKRDGYTYKTVKIGDQYWMAQNLNFAAEGSRCYKDTLSYCDRYGRLYTWGEAMDSVAAFSENGKGCGYNKTCSPTYPVRGVCPEGWHLPDSSEINRLIGFAGGPDSAGAKLKSTSGWCDERCNGTDDYGFNAFPVGTYSRQRMSNSSYVYNVTFGFSTNSAHFWTSTEVEDTNIFNSIQESVIGLSFQSGGMAYTYTLFRYSGYPLRCLKNE